MMRQYMSLHFEPKELQYYDQAILSFILLRFQIGVISKLRAHSADIYL